MAKKKLHSPADLFNNNPQVSSTVADRLKQVLPDPEKTGMSHQELVEAVFGGLNEVVTGDPVGTVRRDDAGGVYVRVDHGGIHKWLVVDPDTGNSHFDMQQQSATIVAEPLPEEEPEPPAG